MPTSTLPFTYAHLGISGAGGEVGVGVGEGGVIAHGGGGTTLSQRLRQDFVEREREREREREERRSGVGLGMVGGLGMAKEERVHLRLVLQVLLCTHAMHTRTRRLCAHAMHTRTHTHRRST